MGVAKLRSDKRRYEKSIMVVGEGLDLSGGVLHLRLGRMLTISEREVEGQVLPLPLRHFCL